MLFKKTFRRTTLLCVFFVALLVGLAVARLYAVVGSVAAVGILGAVSVTTYKKRNTFAVCALFLFGMSLGILRGNYYIEKIAPYRELIGTQVTLRAVAETSAIYGKNAQLEYDVSGIEILSPIQKKIPGKMTISGYGVTSVLRGDTIETQGKMYKKRGSKQAGISFAKMSVLQQSSSVVESVRREFMAGLATALPEPHDQFAAGLLVGQRSELDEGVTESLRTVGLSHIIAVSGYNLTIMAELARKRFGKKSQFRKAFFSMCFVLAFVAIAGSSASIARAAFVSLLTILAGYYGKTIKPQVLLLLAAATTAMLNPLNLWYDIGWYLSFLAFFGVLLIAPAVTARIYSTKEPKLVGKLLIETTCAQLATLPLLLHLFGDLSLVSLVANMLVVPFVPLAMLLSFIAGLFGMLLPSVALMAGLPARLLMDAMLGVSSMLADVPHALVKVNISLMQMIVSYVVLLAVTTTAYKKSRRPGSDAAVTRVV